MLVRMGRADAARAARRSRATSSRRSAAASPAGARVFGSTRDHADRSRASQNGKAYSFQVVGPFGGRHRHAVDEDGCDRHRRADGADGRSRVCRRNGKAAVSWAPPAASNGAGITGYVVTTIVEELGRRSGRRSPGAPRLAIVTGLRNGVDVPVQGCGRRTRRGAGPPSSPSNTIVPKPRRVQPNRRRADTSRTCRPARRSAVGRDVRGDVCTNRRGSPAPTTTPRTTRFRSSRCTSRARSRTPRRGRRNDKPRITGNFTGTTDEIIQWAACKWGWSDNVVRAQAVDREPLGPVDAR